MDTLYILSHSISNAAVPPGLSMEILAERRRSHCWKWLPISLPSLLCLLLLSPVLFVIVCLLFVLSAIMLYENERERWRRQPVNQRKIAKQQNIFCLFS